MNYHENKRAEMLLDVFPIELSQVNVSYINSTEHIVACINKYRIYNLINQTHEFN